MPFSLRTSYFLVLFCSCVFTCNAAHAQASIEDVHVDPRAGTVAVAKADYGASSAPAAHLGSAPLLHTSAELVLVPVSITDGLHRPVVGLAQANFQLFENKKPQGIKHFSNEDTPVSVGIILDSSSSMRNKMDRAREAVNQFCAAGNPQDEFFMITFADAPRLASDFTNSPDELTNELVFANAKGRTALLDAIYMGIRKMREAKYGRKALLIISDGGDNHSHYTEREVKSVIREADVMIYAVGTYDRYVPTQEELLGPELLRDVTELTGGQAFTLTNPNEMAAVAHNIATQLRHQYVLAYQPQSDVHDGKWHKLSVKLRLPKRLAFLHVTARPGYYAGTE
jgi:Ca-activated chloride channel family protein